MLKILTDWGFTRQSWRGSRGEYWVLGQIVLMLAYVVLPRYSPWQLHHLLGFRWGLAALIGGFGLWLVGRGVLDLGQNLTPLPYPRQDGALVQTGSYGIVRHCLYSGVILLAIAGTLYWQSLPHLLATVVLFIFFDAKASREERWLCDRYPEYPTYQQSVRKLIPFIY